MKIKDALSIDLSEDIKNVIDIEDVSEAEIKSEIENYIITDGLAKEYADFTNTFTSNISETGVWISGFYGSGKSYFGKLLGYMLSNRMIAGTSARDRILHRFTGIKNEALIKNEIARLNTQNCRVVFLDIAKQDTSKGIAFTLFRNFLKTLELPENEHGILLFQLMIDEKMWNVSDYFYRKTSRNWSEVKNRLLEYAKAIKALHLMGNNNESDYNNILTTIRRDMDQFSAARLRQELENYHTVQQDERIVFLFDEASEAINQNKYNLLDLEGLSESLSASGGDVWTIAIAQEKLDDIINNSNLTRAQLTKVTDRFKTKIHLEATEVDVIIRERLLKKSAKATKSINDHYKEHSGKIADHAGLVAAGIHKTDTADSFCTYYPFYKYQFDLMQNFLFGTKGYASTKVAARGMIITTYDILKRELQQQPCFTVATGWQIARQAQPQPHVRLVSRYDNAEKILKSAGYSVSGRQLLETIHFLSEAEVVPTTLANIVKSFVGEPEAVHSVQEDITNALSVLVESRILLYTNNAYRITTDIEQRLLDEMNGYIVQGFLKKKLIVTALKESPAIKTLARTTDGNAPYDFYIITDNDDELTAPVLKCLKIKLKSLYSISDDRSADIETIKTTFQNDKETIWIVPDNSAFREIDTLADEIERIGFLEGKYTDPHSEEVGIVKTFKAVKSDKLERVKHLIEESIKNAVAVYLYNIWQLNKDNWTNILQKQQQQVIQNVYHKRLDSQLPDTIASAVIKEANNSRLKTFFHGDDFLFFDSNGNFIGDNLRVVEEVVYKLRNTFVDGAQLEKDLELPPTGFSFGTVLSTVAALMRAGKVMAKAGGAEKFSWRDDGVPNIFANARDFRKASFKALSRSLSAQQKDEMVKSLQEFDCENTTGKRIDWNSNDFDLANAVRDLARCYCEKVDTLRKSNKDFDTLFSDIEQQKEALTNFTSSVSDQNYINKAENYLNGKDTFGKAITSIDKVEKFIRNNLPKLQLWRSFVAGVNDECVKSSVKNQIIETLSNEFGNYFKGNLVQEFPKMQQVAQKIKDEYFSLMQSSADEMTTKYRQLKKDTEVVLAEINSLPPGLNSSIQQKSTSVLQYAEQRIQDTVEIDFDVKDKRSRFTYSEMLSFIDLYQTKKTDLEILRAGLVRKQPEQSLPDAPEPKAGPKVFRTKIPGTTVKVVQYRQWLHQEIQRVAGADDNDEIEIG